MAGRGDRGSAFELAKGRILVWLANTFFVQCPTPKHLWMAKRVTTVIEKVL